MKELLMQKLNDRIVNSKNTLVDAFIDNKVLGAQNDLKAMYAIYQKYTALLSAMQESKLDLNGLV